MPSAAADFNSWWNRFRTGVVVDVLGRIGKMFGKFEGLLLQIQHEVRPPLALVRFKDG